MTPGCRSPSGWSVPRLRWSTRAWIVRRWRAVSSPGRLRAGCRRAGPIRRRWTRRARRWRSSWASWRRRSPSRRRLRLRAGSGYEREAALATVTLAIIHVQAGEPSGLALAQKAVDGVALLRSVRARERLGPLVDALDARPGADARELASMARRAASQP
jgi:hypothetical protein